jgi:uncharacterized protein
MRIYIKVIPCSSKNQIIEIKEGEYRIKLTAPPISGEANKMLIEILSDFFKVSKKQINIIGGKFTQIKLIEISE